MRQTIPVRISEFHITDRAGEPLHECRDALVPLAAQPDRPIDRRPRADPLLPFGMGRAQIVSKGETGARTIRAPHDGDRLIRQSQAGVDCRERRIVPSRDLAQVNIAQRLAIEPELSGRDPREIDHGHDTADDRRELHQPLGLQFRIAQRRIGSAEIHRLRLDLFQPRAGADRLVIDAIARRRMILRRPLGIERRGETRPRARYIARAALRLRAGNPRRHQAGRRDPLRYMPFRHVSLPSLKQPALYGGFVTAP